MTLTSYIPLVLAPTLLASFAEAGCDNCYCGKDWADANDNCATATTCPDSTDAPCGSGHCYADIECSGGGGDDDGDDTPTPTGDGMVGGYLMEIDSAHLHALSSNAETLPLNRINLAFIDPTMVYAKGSNTLKNTGLEFDDTSGDGGFAELAKHVKTLQDGGVSVFASMGGWNWNCWPYAYATYSVGGYGSATPNYYKIEAYGDLSDCTEDNQYCMVCEPDSEGTTMDSFSIFQQPTNSSSWQDAVSYVEGAAGGESPVWQDLIAGDSYTDARTGVTTTVPGNTRVNGHNPYEEFVDLAVDLGLVGVDLDYEEMWFADMFRGNDDSTTGPWTLDQVVYKYVAIAKTLETAIGDSGLLLSTAAGAAGAWDGDWWGGNLKGVFYFANKWFPDVISYMTEGANAGGLNVMTYDLSDNPEFHECPGDDDTCALDKQVEFYMDTYKTAGMDAAVGYEIFTPAYPDPTHDQDHQLPLTTESLKTMETGVQAAWNGGFYWSLYKPQHDSVADYATSTETAQSICRAVLGSDTARCSGVIPEPSEGDDDDTTTDDADDDSSVNVCDDDSSKCNACDSCCHSYLDGDSCDACVDSECAVDNVCADDAATCNTCDACCHDYLDGDSCDACAAEC
jgi:hypothetical protein